MSIDRRFIPAQKYFMRCIILTLVISGCFTGCAHKEDKKNAVQKNLMPKTAVGCWRLAEFSEYVERNGSIVKSRTVIDNKKHSHTFYVGIYPDGRFVQWIDYIDCPNGIVYEGGIGTIEIVENDNPGRWKFHLPVQVIHRLVIANADTIRFCEYYHALSFPESFDSTVDLGKNQIKQTYDYTRFQFDLDTIQILH